MPSSDYGSLDNDGILPLGVSLNPTADNIEFKGVYSGRKVRYVVERAPEKQCCRNKPLCLNILGEIYEECKCKKCSPAQVPSSSGKSCQDNCADGQEMNGKGGCCPIGMKPNSKGSGCECPGGRKAKPGGIGCEDQIDSSRKGNCPDGQVLDPKEGNKPDDPHPKCQIDDEKDCKKPKIPATRPEGYETDSSYKVDCGNPQSENKRPRCKPGTHYGYTWVDTDGVAMEECRKTKQFQERKRTKVRELNARFKEKWYKQKPQRDQQKMDRDEKMDKLKEQRDKLQKDMEARDKLKEQNDKKKARMGKCSTVTALLMGVAQNFAQKRDEDHPYDMTSDFFDENFFTSDDRLADWPSDVDIDTVACVSDDCVDSEAYMKEWEDIAQRHDLENWPTCSQIGSRSLHARCKKRTVIEPVDDTPSLSSVPFPYADMSAKELSEIKERNPVAIFQIVLEIILFGSRLGMSLLARTATSVARWAPRLANIAKNPDRLFKLAPKGQGTPKGVEGMKEGFRRIVQNPAFKKCLKDGMP
ncbi:hypothetical protein P171DRAFT_405159 [Karstenula rhodostoma CBS 690.94]|uniref:Uncharacterized protein n=1 Tax=Karstenula rhodostoma CBS 690.94 TaxID=1392251 RepID=A0A9P4PT34_9PLEO|nr:hypothetical protein P171DRAFT_405159 [Karstenula rhodostoma CBS 690.94]